MTKRAPPKVHFEVVVGPCGPALYIDNHRVAGPKPWGGGQVTHQFKADWREVLRALQIEDSA